MIGAAVSLFALLLLAFLILACIVMAVVTLRSDWHPEMLSFGRLQLKLFDGAWPAYSTQHGPRHLDWWWPIEIKVYRCNPHIQPNPPTWNVWTYTRWGTWTHHVAIAPRKP